MPDGVSWLQRHRIPPLAPSGCGRWERRARSTGGFWGKRARKSRVLRAVCARRRMQTVDQREHMQFPKREAKCFHSMRQISGDDSCRDCSFCAIESSLTESCDVCGRSALVSRFRSFDPGSCGASTGSSQDNAEMGLVLEIKDGAVIAHVPNTLCECDGSCISVHHGWTRPTVQVR